MPALVLFHRRTIFGGDDLQPTSIITIVVRFIQITLLCIPIIHYTISHLITILHDDSDDDDVERTININGSNSNNYQNPSWMMILVQQLFKTAMTTNDRSSNVTSNTNATTFTTALDTTSENVFDHSMTTTTTTHDRSRSIMIRQVVVAFLGGCTDMNEYYNNVDETTNTNSNDDDDDDNNTTNTTTWKLFYTVMTVWGCSTILFNIGSIVLERYIIYWSGRGTPTTQIQLRSHHIERLLFIKLLPGTVLLGLLSCTAVFGIIAYYIIPQRHYYNYYYKYHTNRTNVNCDYDYYYYDKLGGLGTSFHRNDEPIRTSLWWVAVVILLLAQIIEVFVSILFTYQLFQLPTILPIVDEVSGGIDGVGALSSLESSMYPVVSERMIMNGSDYHDTNVTHQQLNYNHELVEEMWAERCAATCHCLSVSTCYMFGGRNLVDVVGRNAPGTSGGATSRSSHSIFVDVARALADFLESRGVLDVVPSDIVTGLILLQRIQRQRVYTARQQYKARINNVASACQYHDESSKMTIKRVESGILENNGLINDDIMPAGDKRTVPTLQNETSRTIRKRSSSKNFHTTGNQQNEDDGLLILSRSRSKSPDHSFFLPMEPKIRNTTGSQNQHCDDDDVMSQSPATQSAQRYNQQNVIHSYYRMNTTGSGYQREERALLNSNDFTELYLLDEAARYAKYALAIYTWVLYLYEHPITGPFRLLLRNGSNLCCHQNDGNRHRSSYEQPEPQYVSNEISPNESLMSYIDENGRIEGDNICQTHKNAILLTAGLQEADIVYVQLRSSLSDIPYCILLDHAWKSIVVAIRGTFSIEDCITDVLITPEALEKLGIDFGFDAIDEYCHGGVMSCARNVHRDLERHGLLDKLLLGENAKYSGYTLRLVGHSLGAATSTLLSYMLKPKYSNLRCINYSPPGCTFTWKMATQCKDWCTTCVIDTDLVPRLTVESIERLRDEILDLIGRIKVPKAVVAQRFTESTFRLRNDDYDKDVICNDDFADVLYDPDEIPDTDYQQQLVRFKEIQDERRRHRGTSREIQLYPPGRILHLIKSGEKRSCTAGLVKIVTCCTTNVGSTYIPVWVDNDDLNEIVVGPRMGTDHFPHRIRAILDDVATNFGL